GSDNDREDQSDGTRAWLLLVNEFGHACDEAEIQSNDSCRRDGVNHDALRDQIHVHQPVAEDGISESQGQQSKEEYRKLHPCARLRATMWRPSRIAPGKYANANSHGRSRTKRRFSGNVKTKCRKSAGCITQATMLLQ